MRSAIGRCSCLATLDAVGNHNTTSVVSSHVTTDSTPLTEHDDPTNTARSEYTTFTGVMAELQSGTSYAVLRYQNRSKRKPLDFHPHVYNTLVHRHIPYVMQWWRENKNRRKSRIYRSDKEHQLPWYDVSPTTARTSIKISKVIQRDKKMRYYYHAVYL